MPARISLAVLLLILMQPLSAVTAGARDQPRLPELKGLGPRPGHSFSGDCRDPMPDPGQLCIQSARTGSLHISPHVVQACKKSSGTSCPRITATFQPAPGAVIWNGAFKDCASFSYKPNDDLPTGKSGGPVTCSMEATAPTNGWTLGRVGITGPCGSVAAVKGGKAEFASCAGTYASDYFAILPAGVGIIDGTITEKDGKTPISGIAVQVRSSDNHRSVAYTDSTGYYSAYVDEGDYTICPCRFKDDALNNGPPDVFTPRSPNLHVTGYKTQDFVEGGWNIAGTLSRKITRKGDPPLSGVTIGVTGKSGYFREATTDAAGRYSITVPEGPYVVEGLTPPQVRPGEFIDGLPWQCQDAGVVAHTAACVFQLTSDKNSVDMVMNNQYQLKLTEEKKSALPGRQVQKITAVVTDSKGHTVAGKKVHFTASAPEGSKVVLGTPEGGSLYSSVAVAAGAAAGAATGGAAPSGQFERTTDWSGKVTIYKWAAKAGKLALKAALDNSTDTSQDLSTDAGEVASLDDNPPIPSVGPPLPADIGDILEKAVHGRLGARPSPLSTNANLQFNIMNSLNGLADIGNADFEPVRSADDKAGGVIVYPKNTDDKAIAAIAAFLAKPDAGTQASPAVSGALVIDMDEVGKLVRDSASNRIIPSRLTPLATFATAHPASVEGYLDRTDETGIRGGTLHRGANNPPAVQKRTPADRALGATHTGTVIRTRGKVRVIATVTTGVAGATAGPLAGKTAGVSAGRSIVMDIPQAEVVQYAKIPSSIKLLAFSTGMFTASDNTSGDGEEVDYYLPPGLTYDIEVTGTGSGKASVAVLYGTDGTNATGFTVDAAEGRSGTFSVSAESVVAGKMVYGGKTINADNGPHLKLEGFPRDVTVGSPQAINLRVVDQFGDPVAGARVDVGSKTYFERGWSDTDGVVSLPLNVPTTEALGARAIVNGYTDALVTARVKPRPRGGTAEAMAAIAGAPGSPLTTLKGMFDSMIVAVAGVLLLLLVFAVILVRRRRQFLRVVNP
jgi:hypothetical protein